MHSTFEASTFFRRILRRCFPLREFSYEGDNYRLFLWKHPFYQRLISTPYRDRLALEWEGDEVRVDTDRLSRAFDRKTVVLKDVNQVLGAGYALTNQVNCHVSLDEEIELRFEPSARKNLRRSSQVYQLEFSANPVGEFESFYDMYLRTRHRLGVLPYPRRMFRQIFEALGGEAVLFRCRRADLPLGYLLCYLHGQEMISAHIAYDFAQRQLRITDFLFMSAFFWGRDQGYTRYRFGADPSSQEGLIRSKTKLGAQPRTQTDWLVGGSRQFLLQAQNSERLRALISRTPKWLYPWYSQGFWLYFS